MKIRDRVRELRRVRAGDLRPNPHNWRVHPVAQRDALRGILSEIGYADALLARETADGSLELIDGHLRAETTPDEEVPVLVVDLDDAEADKLLAVLDPLAGMAQSDSELLAELLESVETDDAAVQKLLDSMADDVLEHKPPKDLDIPEAFQVVVECDDECRQRELFERLEAEGYRCRLLTLF